MIIRGESIDDYHKNHAVSASKLREFRQRGPEYYRQKFIDRIPMDDDTEAKAFGRAFDVLMTLGKDAFDQLYAVRPEGMDGRSTAAKEFKKANEHKITLSWDDAGRMNVMQGAIMRHPIAAKLIERCESQVTIRTPLEAYPITLQSRPDWLSTEPIDGNGGKNYTVDLKTTDDLSEWFNPYEMDDATRAKAVHVYGYHRQAAIVRWTGSMTPLGELAPYLLVSEKKPPFRCAVFSFNSQYLDLGQREVERDLAALSDCIRRSSWPGSPESIIDLSPPNWLIHKVDNEDFWNA